MLCADALAQLLETPTACLCRSLSTSVVDDRLAIVGHEGVGGEEGGDGLELALGLLGVVALEGDVEVDGEEAALGPLGRSASSTMRPASDETQRGGSSVAKISPTASAAPRTAFLSRRPHQGVEERGLGVEPVLREARRSRTGRRRRLRVPASRATSNSPLAGFDRGGYRNRGVLGFGVDDQLQVLAVDGEPECLEHRGVERAHGLGSARRTGLGGGRRARRRTAWEVNGGATWPCPCGRFRARPIERGGRRDLRR